MLRNWLGMLTNSCCAKFRALISVNSFHPLQCMHLSLHTDSDRQKQLGLWCKNSPESEGVVIEKQEKKREDSVWQGGWCPWTSLQSPFPFLPQQRAETLESYEEMKQTSQRGWAYQRQLCSTYTSVFILFCKCRQLTVISYPMQTSHFIFYGLLFWWRKDTSKARKRATQHTFCCRFLSDPELWNYSYSHCGNYPAPKPRASCNTSCVTAKPITFISLWPLIKTAWQTQRQEDNISVQFQTQHLFPETEKLFWAKLEIYIVEKQKFFPAMTNVFCV